MQLHQLSPVHKNKKNKRVGRGGKKGTYAGRGIKGQKSRAGAGIKPYFAGGDTPLSKRLPKMRGQTHGRKKKVKRGVRLSRLKTQARPAVFNFESIIKKFKPKEIISPQTLFAKGLLRRVKGRIPPVKILSFKKTDQEVKFKNVRFAQKQAAKAEK